MKVVDRLTAPAGTCWVLLAATAAATASATAVATAPRPSCCHEAMPDTHDSSRMPRPQKRKNAGAPEMLLHIYITSYILKDIRCYITHHTSPSYSPKIA